ncbi:3,4-dihydroxy-2-butanone-4-phosphate synthase [Saxibacter everestensis]|uniref:GTP cyclohydrolase-2 n=1 Tax=Saxibacter everestensis TaxID=2909229 RepID=A0ABY8QWW9_9MICO|nr:3,4-dihydroxy-2-butanone-4-phosphate synthase [Brevibacteriaceae bacterium ZFBP1038]
MNVRLDTIPEALAALAAGKPVAVVDDASRENEGDLILAAEHASAASMAFLVRHTSGVLCAPLPASRLDALALPPMTAINEDAKGTAYSVSVDARIGVTTGISAADRARTCRLLASAETTPAQLTRPGHVFPLRAREHGVLARRGHTEAAIDLTRLAGCSPAGVIGELVADDGSIMDAPATREFCDSHGLVMISIEDLVAYRYLIESPLSASPAVLLPSTLAQSSPGDDAPRFMATAYRNEVSDDEHLVLTLGLDARSDEAPLVRVHSECLTGDVFGSSRCDCGNQLRSAMQEIAEAGRGVLIYLRGHEGRGIGLTAKLQAYALQEAGRDTVDANLDLGLPVDDRSYHAAAAILRDLDVTRIRLLSNNPGKRAALEKDGIEVTAQLQRPSMATPENLAYLTTKRDRMGHVIDIGDLPAPGRSSGTTQLGVAP